MKKKLYEGSSKILYSAEEDFLLIMAFSDKAVLETGETVDISGKGVLNNSISSFLMGKLEMIGIENHLIEKINMREQLIQYVEVFPIQVIISSVACGRFVKEFGMDEGYVFDKPIIDFKVRSREFNYPIVNEYQIFNFGWLTMDEIRTVQAQTLRIYDFLSGLFIGIGIRLVECKLEFGRVFNGEESIIMLTDEISPDNCRLWHINSNEKLGFELIENEPNKAFESYQLIANRLKEK
ncbi:phosphoribosylaminoimidazolesuccinocarboxamide synthase [Rickettsia typhi]|uniref:Phosphoribosylaminoimidazole-succinocarboxamide synthase n=2 Tax=Rickettsia typhi TaxID=785 RepID=PUR7_RICTY|nr:phosphoribosylaminoimidazolesuccinocarboxamide synthase [Rickettsia typhi]Q68XE9.1 RecName: Full=Phosphoribosylaminoimidazole-succinocarboxamide synthase; AltName: Full=SAICAR synthetase [Rickettsia typhi str. Wilmington]AAU03693.1 phosphoribosylaminoimidazole-succinocarboxamide synthase [Rickettsia typhi str. Wilmington]AFE54070.1 phosphoribosylaminoimidazole-succinocarboxamide synthase [Rickettsia typhi str. TH1527]AFE54909.1 phosphoribosylaminoimidazole-succinocarboxamide synthase [Ricket